MYRIFGILSIILIILTGCGSTSSGSGSEESDQNEPPEASITIQDKAVSFQQGSYCWSGSGQGVCIDKSGAVDLTEDVEPVIVQGNESIKISYEQEPSELYVRVLKDGSEHANMKDKFEFQTPSEPGTYVYDVFAKWREKGDLALAFKIKVQ
ncbi:hypothetical protein ACSVDE_19185 [Pseudalkalibacillus sp. Hm43]|uniref:hypothetical protein n=1 Tax=Pseudalkalibacillus sp. Hm43 TaxID=3450742 RepID=UPI003F4437F3